MVVVAHNAQVILERRYSQRDTDFQPLENPEQIFHRVAKAVARVEKNAQSRIVWESRFYDMMINFDFLPNSPTIMNAGTKSEMLSGCFVIPVPDSMEGIFAALYNGAMIQRFGGGVGYNFSNLRSEGSFITKTQGKASGPITFMEAFDTMCQTIKQGGKRRGAQMAILRVDHPDIRKFIQAKVANDSRLTNFNISVAITDDFMNKVEHCLKTGNDAIYGLIDPHSGYVCNESVMDIWNLIIDSAHRSADPGVWFIDKANELRPFDALTIDSTNPCGEQALEDFNSCNLGSINLGHFVWENDIRWKELKETVCYAVRFLDNVIDINQYPEQLEIIDGKPVLGNPIDRMTKYTRRIGLGVMGWADMLAKLEIPYDSDEAVILASRVMFAVNITAKDESHELAKEKGAFPGWEDSNVKDRPYRNCSWTTVAPTGTISRIANCSSGIEPNFALSYVSEVMDGDKLEDIPELFKEYLAQGEIQQIIDQETAHAIIEWVKTGTLHEYVLAKFGRSIDKHAQWWKTLIDVFKTTNEIRWESHVNHQAAFQEYVSNSISKTINMPVGTPREHVEGAYLMAYRTGCRGITVYVDQSKSTQVLNRYQSSSSEVAVDSSEQVEPMVQHGTNSVFVKERPHVINGKTTRVRTGHGNAFITVNSIDGKPFELFTNVGKAGEHDSASFEAISRLISLCLRAGIEDEIIVKQLRGISCCPVWDDGVLIKSVPDAISHVLSHNIDHEHVEQDVVRTELTTSYPRMEVHIAENKHDNEAILGEVCSECSSSNLKYQEGCVMCGECGYSSCG